MMKWFVKLRRYIVSYQRINTIHISCKKIYKGYVMICNKKHTIYFWTLPYKLDIYTRYNGYQIQEELSRNLWNNDITIYKRKIMFNKRFVNACFYLKINNDLKIMLADQIYDIEYFYQYVNEKDHLARIHLWPVTNRKIHTSTNVFRNNGQIDSVLGMISTVDLYQKNGEISNINLTLSSGVLILYDLNAI